MNIEEKYNILLTWIKRWADLETSRDELQETIDRQPDMGDPTDTCYDIGQASADAYNALECRDLLKQIGELGNETLN